MPESTGSTVDARRQRSRWLRRVVIVLLLISVAFALAWLMVLRSDAYRRADSYVRSHPAVIDALGPIEGIMLAPLGYALDYGSMPRQARLRLRVIGQQREGVAHVTLIESDAGWVVVDARLADAGDAGIPLR